MARKTKEKIYLRGNHPWLNFSESKIILGKRVYISAEHLFQALKSPKRADHEYVNRAANPFEAKSRGREVTLRRDWEEVKMALMIATLLLKFCMHRKLRRDLMKTWPAELIEARKDPIWGIGPDGKGKNMMGQCLFITRAILLTSKEAMEEA